MELCFTDPALQDDYLYSMSPSAIKALLLKVLLKSDHDGLQRYVLTRILNNQA